MTMWRARAALRRGTATVKVAWRRQICVYDGVGKSSPINSNSEATNPCVARKGSR
jgi:hypothetical protein